MNEKWENRFRYGVSTILEHYAGENQGRRSAQFCPKQTLVLTEQFSSMERDAFHVSYLSDKIPEAVFHGQAVKTVAYLRVSTAQQDEGGYFSHREPHSGSRWERWNVGEGTPEISVLISDRGRSVPGLTVRDESISEIRRVIEAEPFE